MCKPLFEIFFDFFAFFFPASFFNPLKKTSSVKAFPDRLPSPFRSGLCPHFRAYHFYNSCTLSRAYHPLRKAIVHQFSSGQAAYFRHYAQLSMLQSIPVYWYTSGLPFCFSALKRFTLSHPNIRRPAFPLPLRPSGASPPFPHPESIDHGVTPKAGSPLAGRPGLLYALLLPLMPFCASASAARRTRA